MIEHWAAAQPSKPKLPEAVRRLIATGLLLDNPAKRRSKVSKANASRMASHTIDLISDPGATASQRRARRRRLVQGPAEFRAGRVD
jgi:hypothetical protein